MSLRKIAPRRIGGLLTLASLAVLFILPASASAFGTVWGILGQHSEHERVTRLALQCGKGQQPPDCFQPVSLDNLAGKRGSFGAVGAPDDIPLHLNVDRDYWHCDNADWINPSLHGLTSYPQSRTAALDSLRECLSWGKDKLYDGGRGRWSLPPATPSNGAIATASQLIKRNGTVDDSNPGVGFFSPGCTYNGVESGRAKCNVLEPFGYVLHMAEDFYAHTNWADYSVPGAPLSLTNPYGLGSKDIAPFLDLRTPLPADSDIPANFTGGCYPKKGCAGRVIHGESYSDLGINKDKAMINTDTGDVTEPNTPRGAIVVDGVTNATRTVNLSVREARRQWEVFRGELAQRYGTDRAAKMICALVLDHSETCDKRNVVVAIDTDPPRRGTGATASASASAVGAPLAATGQQLLKRLTRTDRVAVVTFDSRTGAHDVDSFVAPSRASFDDPVSGDAAPDPSTRHEDEVDRKDDPTITDEPDDPVGVPPAPGTHTHGTEEGAAHTSAARTRGSGAGPVAALRAASALLVNSDAPRGQRGVLMVTRTAPASLTARVRALGNRGAAVSLAYYGRGNVSRALTKAVEASGGTVVVTRNAAELRRFAHVADVAGLTRLDDALPRHEVALGPKHPVVQGITDGGADVHPVVAQRKPRKLQVRALDASLRVVLTNHATGKSRRVKAPRGELASLNLPAAGNYEVAVTGDSGHRYRIVVQPRR